MNFGLWTLDFFYGRRMTQGYQLDHLLSQRHLKHKILETETFLFDFGLGLGTWDLARPPPPPICKKIKGLECTHDFSCSSFIHSKLVLCTQPQMLLHINVTVALLVKCTFRYLFIQNIGKNKLEGRAQPFKNVKLKKK